MCTVRTSKGNLDYANHIKKLKVRTVIDAFPYYIKREIQDLLGSGRTYTYIEKTIKSKHEIYLNSMGLRTPTRQTIKKYSVKFWHELPHNMNLYGFAG